MSREEEFGQDIDDQLTILESIPPLSILSSSLCRHFETKSERYSFSFDFKE